MTKTLTSRLVGAYHRMPAKGILACLPAGTKLMLAPEPDNPYDANAIKVVWKTDRGVMSFDVGLDQLKPHLDDPFGGTGYDLGDVLAQPEWHLGYLPNSDNPKTTKPEAGYVGNREIGQLLWTSGVLGEFPASLAFDADGNPLVKVGVG